MIPRSFKQFLDTVSLDKPIGYPVRIDIAPMDETKPTKEDDDQASI